MSTCIQNYTDEILPFNPLVRFRVALLLLVTVISGLAFSQLSKLESDNSNEAFFTSGDDTIKHLNEFKATFGNDDFVFILVDTSTHITPKVISQLAELTDRLEVEVPYLSQTTWIGNAERIKGVSDGILIDHVMPDLKLTQLELSTLLDSLASDPLYQNRLISADGKTLGILLEFNNYPEEETEPRKESPPVINAILNDFDELETYVVGSPVTDYEMDVITSQEAPIWTGVALLGMCLMLAITTRGIAGVLIPALTVFLSVIWTMAIVASLGFRLNLLVIMVPSLLLCVGIGDSMHIVADLQRRMHSGQYRLVALNDTLAAVTRPLILTSVTTATGFLAFLGTDLVPLQQLGIQAATGVFIALLLTYIFAIPLLSFGRERKPDNAVSSSRQPDIFEHLLVKTADFVINNKTLITALFGAVIVFNMVGMSKLIVETNTIQDLPKEHPLRSAYDYVDSRMGGSMSIEFVLDTKQPDGIKNLEVLRHAEDLQQYLNSHPRVTQTSSIIDQLKQMNRALHYNQSEWYRLPSSNQQPANSGIFFAL